MAFAHSNRDFDGGRPKGGPRLDLSFARHFVGVFALTFSAAVFFAIVHYVFRV